VNCTNNGVRKLGKRGISDNSADICPESPVTGTCQFSVSRIGGVGGSKWVRVAGSHATLWQNRVPTNLGAPGAGSLAVSINNRSEVVGG